MIQALGQVFKEWLGNQLPVNKDLRFLLMPVFV